MSSNMPSTPIPMRGGWTPPYQAVDSGSSKCYIWHCVITKEQIVIVRDVYDGHTALHIAASDGFALQMD